MLSANKIWIIIEAALVAIIVVLMFSLKYIKARANQQRSQVSAKAILQNPAAKVITVFRDTGGRTHIEVFANAGQIPEDALRDTGLVSKTFADSIARQDNIKASQINELTREKIQLKAENIQLKAESNKPDNHLFSYQDHWLKLNYDIETNRADMQYSVNIITNNYTPAKTWPFKQSPAVLDFSADDPRAKVESVDHLIKQLPSPVWGLQVQAKGYYDFTTGQIIPAIGANIRWHRWHLEDNLYYQGKVKQAAGLAFDFVNINW